jgi:ferric-dicitrate binding protein FerR (iron transport regulator)
MTQNERDARGVDAWRHEQLVCSGFPRPLASRIARDARYDLHALIELVERGCRAELAVRILAPVEQERT